VTTDNDGEESPFIEYDIATYPSDPTLAGVVEMWRNKDITIPDFNASRLDYPTSSLLIDSFLSGPTRTPVFSISTPKTRPRHRGQQRILSIVSTSMGILGPKPGRVSDRYFVSTA